MCNISSFRVVWINLEYFLWLSVAGQWQYLLLKVDIDALICFKGSPKTKYKPMRSLERNLSVLLHRSSAISTFIAIPTPLPLQPCNSLVVLPLTLTGVSYSSFLAAPLCKGSAAVLEECVNMTQRTLVILWDLSVSISKPLEGFGSTLSVCLVACVTFY